MSQGDTSGLSLFERRTVRRVWHRNEWFYSVVDVIAVLTHWTFFWVELDEYPELKEVPFRFQELQKLPSRMNKQQLTAYCKQCVSTERDEDRRDAYLSLTHYLNGEWAGSLVGPLSHFTNPQDIINVLITWSSEIRKQIVRIRENNNALDFANKYEVHAQVYDELRELLMPTSKTVTQRV